MTSKTAVVLMNLGGPLARGDIQPFLFNFFMDKNIIAAPLPIRYMLAKWISWSRSRGAANTAYAALGYKSPLLDNTKAQAAALQKKLGEGMRVFVSMRYWHPMADETVRAVKDYDPDNIVLLPLYPQFSTTTSFSSFEDWARAAAKAGLKKPTREIGCYPLQQGFIAASVENIRAALASAPPHTRVLFSAHGLPEKVVAGGDPYQWQCEQTAAEIARLLGGGIDWQICYQSRVGPLKWIGPSTEEALEKAARDGVGVVIYPHAFVSEHVETLVEIEQEYRHKATELKIPYYARVPTVATHDTFISGLAERVAEKEPPVPLCPDTFNRCYCRSK